VAHAASCFCKVVPRRFTHYRGNGRRAHLRGFKTSERRRLRRKSVAARKTTSKRCLWRLVSQVCQSPCANTATWQRPVYVSSVRRRPGGLCRAPWYDDTRKTSIPRLKRFLSAEGQNASDSTREAKYLLFPTRRAPAAEATLKDIKVARHKEMSGLTMSSVTWLDHSSQL